MNIKIPYRLQLILPIIGWAIICFIFNIITILNTVHFSSQAKKTFLILSLIYLLSFLFITIQRVILNPCEDAKVLDANVKKNKLLPHINTEKATRVFLILSKLSKKYLMNAFYLGICYLALVYLWQFFSFRNHFDIVSIALINIVTISLFTGFTLFWFQFQTFSVLKECRDFLLLHGSCLIEQYFSSIKAKFFFLFFFFIDALILYFISISSSSIGGIIFFVGLVMIIFVTSILFFYLNRSFDEFFNLAKMVSKEDLSIFSTGSLDKEFVDLSKNLNEVSLKLYSSKQEAVKARQEMEKRVSELERFFELTVNREEKMIELKKENEELRKKSVKNKKHNV